MNGRRKRTPLFDGYWRDEQGARIGRVTRDEMREVWRLWTKHRDIREGRVRA